MKVASKSPLTTTSFKLFHQMFRGFLRNSSGSLPWILVQVHWTSLAVNGLPSCHCTPLRRTSVSLVCDASHDQLSASSGTMVSRPLRGFDWLKMRRLLKTPENAMAVAIVASSIMEALG